MRPALWQPLPLLPDRRSSRKRAGGVTSAQKGAKRAGGITEAARPIRAPAHAKRHAVPWGRYPALLQVLRLLARLR